MTVETFETKDLISVSAAAAEHFARQLDKENASAIRLSLKSAGCTGYKYVIDEVDQAKESDIKVQLDNNVVVYVDADNIAGLRGTHVDYVKQGLNYNLQLHNPNVKDSCGCGESFNF